MIHGVLLVVGALFFVATLILWFTKDETDGAQAKSIAQSAATDARDAKDASVQTATQLSDINKKLDNLLSNKNLIEQAKPTQINWPTEPIPIQIVDRVRVSAIVRTPPPKTIPPPPKGVDPKTHPLLHRAGQAVTP